MVGAFRQVGAQSRGEEVFIARSFHVRMLAFGRVVRISFLLFMAMVFPHDSVRVHDKEFSAVCMIAVPGVFPSYDERGQNCVFSCGSNND